MRPSHCSETNGFHTDRQLGWRAPILLGGAARGEVVLSRAARCCKRRADETDRFFPHRASKSWSKVSARPFCCARASTASCQTATLCQRGSGGRHWSVTGVQPTDTAIGRPHMHSVGTHSATPSAKPRPLAVCLCSARAVGARPQGRRGRKTSLSPVTDPGTAHRAPRCAVVGDQSTHFPL